MGSRGARGAPAPRGERGGIGRGASIDTPTRPDMANGTKSVRGGKSSRGSKLGRKKEAPASVLQKDHNGNQIKVTASNFAPLLNKRVFGQSSGSTVMPSGPSNSQANTETRKRTHDTEQHDSPASKRRQVSSTHSRGRGDSISGRGASTRGRGGGRGASTRGGVSGSTRVGNDSARGGNDSRRGSSQRGGRGSTRGHREASLRDTRQFSFSSTSVTQQNTNKPFVPRPQFRHLQLSEENSKSKDDKPRITSVKVLNISPENTRAVYILGLSPDDTEETIREWIISSNSENRKELIPDLVSGTTAKADSDTEMDNAPLNPTSKDSDDTVKSADTEIHDYNDTATTTFEDIHVQEKTQLTDTGSSETNEEADQAQEATEEDLEENENRELVPKEKIARTADQLAALRAKRRLKRALKKKSGPSASTIQQKLSSKAKKILESITNIIFDTKESNGESRGNVYVEFKTPISAILFKVMIDKMNIANKKSEGSTKYIIKSANVSRSPFSLVKATISEETTNTEDGLNKIPPTIVGSVTTPKIMKIPPPIIPKSNQIAIPPSTNISHKAIRGASTSVDSSNSSKGKTSTPTARPPNIIPKASKTLKRPPPKGMIAPVRQPTGTKRSSLSKSETPIQPGNSQGGPPSGNYTARSQDNQSLHGSKNQQRPRTFQAPSGMSRRPAPQTTANVGRQFSPVQVSSRNIPSEPSGFKPHRGLEDQRPDIKQPLHQINQPNQTGPTYESGQAQWQKQRPQSGYQPGPQQGAPQGRPQNLPQGRPQGMNQGPPQGRPQGPSQGQPQGPPQGYGTPVGYRQGPPPGSNQYAPLQQYQQGPPPQQRFPPQRFGHGPPPPQANNQGPQPQLYGQGSTSQGDPRQGDPRQGYGQGAPLQEHSRRGYGQGGPLPPHERPSQVYGVQVRPLQDIGRSQSPSFQGAQPFGGKSGGQPPYQDYSQGSPSNGYRQSPPPPGYSQSSSSPGYNGHPPLPGHAQGPSSVYGQATKPFDGLNRRGSERAPPTFPTARK